MKQPIIKINDFKGGITLNEKLGREDNFQIGNKLDFFSKKGYLTVAPAWKEIEASSPTRYPFMVHLTNGNFYLGGEDAKIYKLGSDYNTLSVARTSTQTGAIRGLVEFKNYLYYSQATTIGRYGDLTGTPSWTDNWKTGLANVSWHPLWVSVDGKMYIGNQNKIDKFDGTTYLNNALDLGDSGWLTRTICDFGMMYLAIGASYQKTANQPLFSKIFLWDRLSASWNDEIFIPEREIKAMKFSAGFLWIWAGRSCNLYVVPEGSRRAIRIWTFVKEEPHREFEVYPGSITDKLGVIYFALSKVGEYSKDFNPCGIYSFPADPENFSLNIPFTTYFDGKGFKEEFRGIGVLRGTTDVAADIIYASYWDTNTNTQKLYREKLVGTDSAFYSDTGIYQSFKYDAPPDRKILTEDFGVQFYSFPSGCNVSLYYRKDTDTSWTALFQDFSTANTFEKRITKRVDANSLQIKLEIRGSLTDIKRPFVKSLYVTGDIMPKS